MSDRPLIAPKKAIIDAGDMSGDIIGPVSIIQRLPGISYDIAWTGDPVGTFSVQVSNTCTQDAAGNPQNDGNWNTLPPSAFIGTIPAPDGTPDNGFIDVLGTEAYAIRLIYTSESGAGSLTVYTAAKVL